MLKLIKCTEAATQPSDARQESFIDMRDHPSHNFSCQTHQIQLVCDQMSKGHNERQIFLAQFSNVAD